MLAKITTKNQITIPKKIMDQMPGVKYFEVELKEATIILKPLRIHATDLERIRSKIKRLGLKQSSVDEAIRWARSK
jgi:bifunctional DNA-binding transcriptional regulator/antitoxin component of YhaV-PrlF toxin-antitoxin module